MSTAEQGSPEWFAARAGKVTASRVADIIAKTKSGYSASRANYMADLLVERLTGQKTEGFTSSAMQWGVDHEPAARDRYAFMRDVDVEETGFVIHPAIEQSGASPDGLCGDDGLIEIKCPNTATHIETLLNGEIPAKYITQMQWQMACTKRAWCDFVSYDPRLPSEMQLFIKRVYRSDETITELEREVLAFLSELETKQNELQATVARKAA